MRTCILATIAAFLAANSLAQETAAQRHAMATNQLKRLTVEMSARCLNDIRSLDDWKAQRTELRRQLLEMLGLDPFPKRTQLKAQITGRLKREAYNIEKIVFQSMPGLYVTGNFYVPRNAAKALPTILYLCGHSPHPLGAKVSYQDRASWFASHGFPCLVLDTLEFGEVAGIHHGTHNLNMWHWFSLGYTPAGLEVWNAIRALDYLETRPEVDMRRVGLSGISGGGAMTWYTAAVDERIAVAAPVCSTFTYGSQAEHWLARGQCDCIYYNNTYQWDFPIVGALIAPRPLLIISGQKDSIFPPDGYHEVYQRAKRVYDLYAGANSDRIHEVDDAVGHSDPPAFLREARQWMQRWLKDDPTPLPLETNSLPEEKAEDLACLATLPPDAVNYKVQHQFVSPLNSKISKPAQLRAALKAKVFNWFPTNNIPFETHVLGNSGGYMPKYAEYKDLSFQTETGVRLRAQLLAPQTASAKSPLLIYIKRPGDSIYPIDTDELLPLLGRYTVIILQPRFTEVPLSPSEFTDVERTAVWIGRTVAAIQVWDILRTLRWATEERQIPYSSISLYGKGDMGVLAMYAALFDDRIQQIVLNDPPASHWQHPGLLNVLRVTDIPQVAASLAHCRLLSVTKAPQSFARARIKEAASLPEALEVWRY